ncbi:unnamed protein product [Prorocentrum cordatum]|uniref:Uncharacterized protein n=1 Tax=Prorocentrum cordatum TaxID=2364126 RepID=A0ABN9PPH8_9DINO|nr:unnamed protein product [Polarella glacialis]
MEADLLPVGGGDAQLDSWSATCARFFRGGDADARAALEHFDAACSPGGGQAPAPVTAVGAARLLAAAGLLDLAGAPVPLSAERYGAYVSARNAARSAVHLEGARARRERLGQLVAELGGAAPAAAREASELPTRLAAERMRASLSAFGRAYGGEMMAHPFLRGLRELLQQQLGCPSVVRWTLREEVFMEAAGEAFMADALRLLMHVFCFVPREELGEEGTGGGCLAWEVAPDLSDARIGRLLALLPPEARLEGRATGDVSRTSRQRTNAGGESDEAEGLAALLRGSCALL